MATIPLERALESFKTALDKLEVLSLPMEHRLALQNARQRLADLSGAVLQSHEQTRLAALYRVSQMLGTSLDLDEVIKQAMDAVIALTSAERGFLVLLDAESKDWQLRAGRNFSLETLQNKDMAVSRTVIDSVIASGKGVVTTDAQSDPRFSTQDSVVFYALRSILCAPLLSRGQVIGAVYVDNRAQAGLFNVNDLEMLNAFATQAAILIENARLYTRTDQALSQRVAELETLTLIDRDLNTYLDLSLILEITLGWLERGVSNAKAWILLSSQDDSKDGHPSVFPQDFPDKLDPLIERSTLEGSPQFSPPQHDKLACLSVPILHGGKPLGAIYLQRPEPFSEMDARFTSRLANRAAAAIENARLYHAVQQANLAKSQFVSVVSHELRIPMTSIKGYTDLLRQGVVGPVNEQQCNFLDVIRNNVERMTALVSDLSDISRVETGRLKLESAMIQVTPCIEETLNSLRPKMQEKDQTLRANIPANLPSVFADPNRLVQVLTNLVSNAWKYTPQGGQIRIAARSHDGRLRIEVIDNGIGIKPEDQARLFSQFFRSDDPQVRSEQGWGLGLSVAKRIVELMGGELGFDSTLGKGSTFWFTLPTAEPKSIESGEEK